MVGGARPIDNTVFRAYETLPVVQVDDPPPPPKDILDRPTAARDRGSGSRSPLIDETLVVTVDEGTSEAWTRVPSLLHSSGRDKHWVVRRDEDDYAWIEFGNNTYGKVPRRGPEQHHRALPGRRRREGQRTAEGDLEIVITPMSRASSG